MFEKEAEEYACEYARQYLHNDGSGLTNSYYETYNGYYRGANDGYSKAKEEDKALIEKMKCCENCKHSDTECEGYTICGIGHYDDCLSNKVLYHTADEKDYWELEEND